jgi:uncharacterized phage protein (TIGR01671 family)
MRTIKFRVFDKESKKIMPVTSLRHFSSVYVVNNMDTLMQFTGLKDKNGKEIYEGDILHIIEAGDYGGEYNAPVSYLDNWAVFGIVLLNCKEISKSKTNKRVETIWTRGFLVRRLGSCVQLHEAIEFELCEVIGNVWENPKLLK